jgi:hypothetical protein
MTEARRPTVAIAAALGVVSILFVLASRSVGQEHNTSTAVQVDQDSESILAFASVAAVLTSPRCMNCHVPGDSPLQGDQGTPHTLSVKRGLDGRGTPGMRCTNCHQDENSRQPHGPPGAPGWRLPSPSTRLAWQGLSVGDICRAVKDPGRNGGKSLPQLIEHVRDDRFVNWAWNPGPNRSVPPLPHDAFVAKLAEWTQTGAACPGE